MALSRLDVSTAAHCAIRPLLLFRKWEDASRAIIGVNVWWECVELSPHHFRAAQAHALVSRPEMALSRLDVSTRLYTAAHCIIRPILLFRKWEEVSRAIFGVNMWWECVEFPPHHFGAAQAHALATRPGHGAESSRRANIYINIIIDIVIYIYAYSHISATITTNSACQTQFALMYTLLLN